MNRPAGDDRPGELTDSYATRAPSPETIEEMDRIASSSGELFAQEQAEKVPVFLLPERREFEQTLLAYGLVDPEAFETFLGELPGGRPEESVVLARALVQAGVLTRYQASAVLQGKAKVLTIGPYVVLERIGSGGMGLVFQARHRQSGDVVALKLLPPSASKQEQAVLRFQREARIMAQLDHVNIVSSRDIGEHNGVHYLVMDHVEGRDLHRIVRADGPLEVRQAVDCIIQAAKGLDAAHGRGIIHRDIKPANLMVDLEGTVRVLDLGLARITRSADPLQARESDPSLTHSGMIMGTVDFLPPEQSNNSKLADQRSDVYALGCTLYYLLTGRSPFDGQTIMERLIAHHQKPVPSLVEVRPDVPASLDAAFRRMLAKTPEQRPQSMTEVIEILEAAFSGDPTASVAPEANQRPRLSSGRVPVDRKPSPSDLSGYEVLTDSQSQLWSPLLDSPTAEIPRPIEARPKPNPAPKPTRPDPTTTRFLVGLIIVLVILVTIAIVTVIYLIQYSRWSNAPKEASLHPAQTIARADQVADHLAGRSDREKEADQR